MKENRQAVTSDLEKSLNDLEMPTSFSFTKTSGNPFYKAASHSAIANKLSAVYLTLADIDQKWFQTRFKREFRSYPLSVIGTPTLCNEYANFRKKTCTGCIMKGDQCEFMEYAITYGINPMEIKVELHAQRDEDGIPVMRSNPPEETITQLSGIIEGQLAVVREVLSAPELTRHDPSKQTDPNVKPPVWYKDYLGLKHSYNRLNGIYKKLCLAEKENDI